MHAPFCALCKRPAEAAVSPHGTPAQHKTLYTILLNIHTVTYMYMYIQPTYIHVLYIIYMYEPQGRQCKLCNVPLLCTSAEAINTHLIAAALAHTMWAQQGANTHVKTKPAHSQAEVRPSARRSRSPRGTANTSPERRPTWGIGG